MASEAWDFSGAEWVPFTSTAIPFTLSAGGGMKFVYLKIKDTKGRESDYVWCETHLSGQ